MNGKPSTEEVKNHLRTFYESSIPKSKERLNELYPITAKKKAERLIQEQDRENFFQEKYLELIEYLNSDERREKQKRVLGYWESHFEAIIEQVRLLTEENKVTNYIKLFF